MEKYTVQIDSETYAISVWDNETPNELNAPFLFQPHWPDGTEWTSLEQAQDWADVFVKSATEPDYAFYMGDNPDKHPQPKPFDYKASAIQKLEALGLTAKEIAAITGR